MTDATTQAHALATAAFDWLLGQAIETPDGLVWTGVASDDEVDHSLYSGGAGIVMSLLEAHHHTADDRYADAALRAARALAAAGPDVTHCSLYFGRTGVAVALAAVTTRLGDARSGKVAQSLLASVRDDFDGERWGEQFELLGGNAGIALGALSAGDPQLALLAVEPYLRTAEPTAAGVHWETRRGRVARLHHISHGTLGVVAALASVADATARPDLLDLAVAGAADVVSRDVAGRGGFLVPHSDPQDQPDLVERYSFGWCHGPAGDAQVFRLLGAVTASPSWARLADRCWQTVLASGLPRRVRPGFWDNNGRCCGTAGVLALAGDRVAEGRDGVDFGRSLVDDLAARATVDAAGARWSNHEHRATPSQLEPRSGWAMGNAGIARELLRFARVTGAGAPAYAVAWPDHPPVRPVEHTGVLAGDLGRA